MHFPENQAHNFDNYFEAVFTKTRENMMLVMDEKGTITEINAAFTRFFGFTRNDIIGKNLSVLFTEADRMMELPQKEIEKVLSRGHASDNNFIVHKDKTTTWVSGESILITIENGHAGIVKIIQNINNQKVSETSLLHLNSFNESILGSIYDVVVVLTNNLEIFKVNKAFAGLFNLTDAAINKVNFAQVIQPFDNNNELVDKIQQVVVTKEAFFHHIIEIGTNQKKMKVFDVSACALEHSGTLNNILLVAHDITLQKQAEKEREDIIGFVAHELRNPLANIVLCNEMMTQLILDNQWNELEDYLNRSKNNVMRLNKMIGELYDATKFNSGNFIPEKTMFDFEEMIEDALDTIEVLHPDYTIALEGKCTVPVYGDRYRLIQVVTNFLSNGIKYSNNNTKVVITIGERDNNVIVSVKDEGLGISSRQLPHIFGKFFRAEKTRNLEGIGLGLYLCRRIIDAHDGKIWAESVEGSGSTFYFSIPVK